MMKFCMLLTTLTLSACSTSISNSGPASAVPDNALHKVWQVLQINQTPPPTKLSVEFRRDGSFSTHGGCNRLFTGYTQNGNRLKFDSAMSTLMACAADSRLMETDDLAGEAVQHTRSYRIQNNRLELLDENGHVLLQAE
ncbi:META domain-containing protein [Neisseria sp.]|uniref:META domain-containing protein n=1 Tax=Neisseria sp. TaxID=192066 RepID=UPI0026DB6921|nr:META domain-containing protein [Neisseria sp.]MDO4907690.1 META domain-containing protein [Neisseria sp.]